tara:strand:+ start:284 stop:1144 length:861 start_codon:yes stop_codon:yes gene_type:complete
MADEILDRIEKHMEGTSLGLAALAEVLQKMDGRMEADDAYAIEKAEQEEAALEHAALVKDIAHSVLIELSDQGMDVDGTDIENVGKPDPTKGATATPNYIGDADDSSETVTPRQSIEEQQASIMAEDDEDEDEEKAMHAGKMKAMHAGKMKAEDDDEDDEEKAIENAYKKVEMADDDEDEDEEKAMLKKSIRQLQKQIEALDISKAVKEESENRLRKMGFKEENGLQRPQLSTNVFGADETPIKKAQTVNDVVDQLTNLSYKELRKMQEFKRQGLTENLPDEIANL